MEKRNSVSIGAGCLMVEGIYNIPRRLWVRFPRRRVPHFSSVGAFTMLEVIVLSKFNCHCSFFPNCSFYKKQKNKTKQKTKQTKQKQKNKTKQNKTKKKKKIKSNFLDNKLKTFTILIENGTCATLQNCNPFQSGLLWMTGQRITKVFILIATHAPIRAQPSYFEVINHKIIKHLPRPRSSRKAYILSST